LTVSIDGVLEEIPMKLLHSSPKSLRKSIEDLSELTNSIREHGLLQPVLVRPHKSGFEIIAGNRRMNACKLLHWPKLPCYVTSLSDKEAFEASLIENIQRQTLNPMEEAEAFKDYTDKFGWGGVSELAAKIGKSPSFVSHSIKLLELPPDVREKISSRELSGSAAAELVWLKDKMAQRDLAQVAVDERLTSSEIRKEVRKQNGMQADSGSDWMNSRIADDQEDLKRVEDRLRKKSMVVLKIAMLRLDHLLREMDDVEYNGSLRECLTNKRWTLHQMIDSFIKDDLKVSRYERKAFRPISHRDRNRSSFQPSDA
jgi:ParB family chromosome partitioning protein